MTNLPFRYKHRRLIFEFNALAGVWLISSGIVFFSVEDILALVIKRNEEEDKNERLENKGTMFFIYLM